MKKTLFLLLFIRFLGSSAMAQSSYSYNYPYTNSTIQNSGQTNNQANYATNYAYNRALQNVQSNSNQNQDLTKLESNFSNGLKTNGSENIVIPNLLLTTTPNLEGYRIKKYIGMVQGLMVKEPNSYQNIQTSISTFFNAGGGPLASYMQMSAAARQESLDTMVLQASKLGANAVIEIRYNNPAVTVSKDQFAVMAACYGTAVVVEKIK